MKKSRFTEEQIIGIVKQHEAGIKTADLCREHGGAGRAGGLRGGARRPHIHCRSRHLEGRAHSGIGAHRTVHPRARRALAFNWPTPAAKAA